MDENIIRYINWIKTLKDKLLGTPSLKRVERSTQKSVEGKAPRPQQDVFENE